MANRAIDWSEELAAAVESAGPGVLRLARHRYPGSATVWDAKAGLVVTTAHAVAHDDSARLTLPGGQERDAQVVGRDPGTDLASLRTDAADRPRPPSARPTGSRSGTRRLALGPRSERAGVVPLIGVLGRRRAYPLGREAGALRRDRSRVPARLLGRAAIDLEAAPSASTRRRLFRGADLTVATATVCGAGERSGPRAP